MTKACMFGDSIGRGTIFNNTCLRYQIIKESFINLFQFNTKLAVKNYSSFGCTVTKGLNILERHTSELQENELVFLEFGGNDCDFLWPAIALSPDEAHLPKTPIKEFESNYLSMIRIVKQRESRPVVLSLPPIDAEKYFKWISRGLNGANILRWLGDVERIYRYHELYNIAACRVANQEKIPLIDVTSPFLEDKNYRTMLCADGIHPNEQGHKLIGRIVTQACADMI